MTLVAHCRLHRVVDPGGAPTEVVRRVLRRAGRKCVGAMLLRQESPARNTGADVGVLCRVRGIRSCSGARARIPRSVRTALVAGMWCFFIARAGMEASHLGWMVASCRDPRRHHDGSLRLLLRICRFARSGPARAGRRRRAGVPDGGDPLQVSHWIVTIGWALEGAAVAWLTRHIRTAACSWSSVVCSAWSSSAWPSIRRCLLRACGDMRSSTGICMCLRDRVAAIFAAGGCRRPTDVT